MRRHRDARTANVDCHRHRALGRLTLRCGNEGKQTNDQEHTRIATATHRLRGRATDLGTRKQHPTCKTTVRVITIAGPPRRLEDLQILATKRHKNTKRKRKSFCVFVANSIVTPKRPA
jgi:hypothetical protein